VDAWETTYLHQLQGEDPVFTWISGTGARPTLQALPDELRAEFETEYKERLRTAYPPGPHGTTLPFRRVFVVAQVPAA
jgi:trans-aconitate 2-methyltransferase